MVRKAGRWLGKLEGVSEGWKVVRKAGRWSEDWKVVRKAGSWLATLHYFVVSA